MKHQKQLSNLEKLRTIIQENEHVDDVDLFFSNVAAEYDEHVNYGNSRATAVQRLTMNGFCGRLKIWHEQLEIGPLPKDPLILNLLDHLFYIGTVSKGQLRVLRRFRMLKINTSGVIEAKPPATCDAFTSIFFISVLTIGCLFIGYLIFNKVSFNQYEPPFYAPLGALLGYGIRLAYDYYWGRLNVSKLLSQKLFLSKPIRLQPQH